MNADESAEILRRQTSSITESHRFAQDKLIAVATAIMGFTVLLIGSNKLPLLNLCFVKISWLFFGIYLALAFGSMWAAVTIQAQNAVRESLIRIDEINIDYKSPSSDDKEKIILIAYLRMKEWYDQNYWKKSKAEREKDIRRMAIKKLWGKYKDDITAICILKDQDMDRRDNKVRLAYWFSFNHEWAYITFAAGLLSLILSVLF